MDATADNVIDAEDEWLLQWNQIDFESLFQETELFQLEQKLTKARDVRDKLTIALKEANNNFDLLQEDFEKQMHKLQYTSSQKEQLIIERDGLLLHVQEMKDANIKLKQQVNEQSASMQKITEDYHARLAETEEDRQQLLGELRSQDARYTIQMEELQGKADECLNLKQLLKRERENMNCPICFCPWEELGCHRLVTLRCGHLFGDSCLRDHLNRCLECPLCRSHADNSQLIYIYGRNVLPNNF
ncbi:uncharacterized protein Dwil_GK27272 [Drosophila willistoni]|uniref:RING-type domain-containing protein n=1 Tax=Drosophila willistoni TaxID=7260 RepID=A0A0Q9WRN9_DROWI|nr:E3 ubiquitin-protein ligase RFWD3 [Drosophila willistoni]KRF98269.1 uncharacterized protein Dwil_GK27272 [Drosophila willistoni]